jgi:hypothetical protein
VYQLSGPPQRRVHYEDTTLSDAFHQGVGQAEHTETGIKLLAKGKEPQTSIDNKVDNALMEIEGCVIINFTSEPYR